MCANVHVGKGERQDADDSLETGTEMEKTRAGSVWEWQVASWMLGMRSLANTLHDFKCRAVAYFTPADAAFKPSPRRSHPTLCTAIDPGIREDCFVRSV